MQCGSHHARGGGLRGFEEGPSSSEPLHWDPSQGYASLLRLSVPIANFTSVWSKVLPSSRGWVHCSLQQRELLSKLLFLPYLAVILIPSESQSVPNTIPSQSRTCLQTVQASHQHCPAANRRPPRLPGPPGMGALPSKMQPVPNAQGTPTLLFGAAQGQTLFYRSCLPDLCPAVGA